VQDYIRPFTANQEITMKRHVRSIALLAAVVGSLLCAIVPFADAQNQPQAQPQPNAHQVSPQMEQQAQAQLQKFFTEPGWQIDIDWAIGNTGAPDCPQLYAATYPECLWNGRNRSCLMEKAIASAKANDCANSFRLTVITQCHNGAAATELAQAGQDNICNYLKTK
jgi:hypothetical protein